MSQTPPSATGRRAPDLIAAGVLAIAVAVLYAVTLCPTVYWYDSAEFSALAASLGVPHPPGYPLYTMVAHVFTWLPGEPAVGVNIMSLVFGVGAVLLAYAIIRSLGGSLRAAVVGGATLAVIRTMWANAVVAEVYTPGLVMTFGALALLLRADATERTRGVWLAGLVGGLGVGMHMSITTFGLGYAWLVWTHGMPQRFAPKELGAEFKTRLKLSLRSALAAASGLLVFAYVPIVKFESWTNREWVGFRKNSTGGAFKRKFLQDYVWADRAQLAWDIFVDNLLIVGLVLAVIGLAWLVSRRPRHAIGVLLAGLGNVWWFFNYSVPDLDVFFLPCLAVLCLGVGLSTDALAHAAARVHAKLPWLSWAVLALPAFLVSRNYETVDLSEQTEASVYGAAACEAIPPRASMVLFSSPEEWRYYSVFIYMQEALGKCTEVEIWKKPRLDRIRRSVHRGGLVYAFRPMKVLESNFELTKEGPLWMLQPKVRKTTVGREHYVPVRRPPARAAPSSKAPSTGR